MNEDFCCPECNGTEFKKEYKSEHNIETYCTRCGLILKKDDLADEYDDTNWSERGFRPNSWDICYANHVTDYFKELSLDFSNYSYEESDDFPGGYSRLPKMGEGNLSEGEVFQEGRISYDEYLKVNSFKDNDESKLKYLRRYNQFEFNKCLEIIGNQNIVKLSDKKPVHQPKYNFGSENTIEIPTLNKYVRYKGVGIETEITVSNDTKGSKYKGWNDEIDKIIQEIKKDLPYYGGVKS